MTADYAWIVTEDRAEPDTSEYCAKGIAGPRNAPAGLLNRLEAGAGYTFRLYDDDENFCYKGRLVTYEPMGEQELHCIAPLLDFGEGFAGCTVVRWHGHPEWDCG